MAPKPRPLDPASAKARFLADPWKPIRDGGARAFVFFPSVSTSLHYFQFLKRYRDHAQGEVIPEIEAFFSQCFDVLARLNDVSGLGNKNLKGTAAYRPLIPSADPSRRHLRLLHLRRLCRWTIAFAMAMDDDDDEVSDAAPVPPPSKSAAKALAPTPAKSSSKAPAPRLATPNLYFNEDDRMPEDQLELSPSPFGYSSTKSKNKAAPSINLFTQPKSATAPFFQAPPKKKGNKNSKAKGRRRSNDVTPGPSLGNVESEEIPSEDEALILKGLPSKTRAESPAPPTRRSLRSSTVAARSAESPPPDAPPAEKRPLLHPYASNPDGGYKSYILNDPKPEVPTNPPDGLQTHEWYAGSMHSKRRVPVRRSMPGVIPHVIPHDFIVKATPVPETMDVVDHFSNPQYSIDQDSIPAPAPLLFKDTDAPDDPTLDPALIIASRIPGKNYFQAPAPCSNCAKRNHVCGSLGPKHACLGCGVGHGTCSNSIDEYEQSSMFESLRPAIEMSNFSLIHRLESLAFARHNLESSLAVFLNQRSFYRMQLQELALYIFSLRKSLPEAELFKKFQNGRDDLDDLEDRHQFAFAHMEPTHLIALPLVPAQASTSGLLRLNSAPVFSRPAPVETAPPMAPAASSSAHPSHPPTPISRFSTLGGALDESRLTSPSTPAIATLNAPDTPMTDHAPEDELMGSPNSSPAPPLTAAEPTD
ncbi:hypothetical protein FB45DRAFT_1033525 [Roridomyces roridus]|uniref:Uncharacterized protein n=1 Tax=Roridomyces roridus TaxID=1738132 RepID=A0AAD7FEU2_9AGAR|nr:hypothetical protein FB45DRAFT_1033525 [Roridomyces roridus]